jgi:hypothetical protein
MRLISTLRRLEAGAAEARERKPAAVGLIWSTQENVVDPQDLRVGEYIAVDLRIQGAAPVVVEGGPAIVAVGAPGAWAMAERITRDPQDLGVVRNAEGGRVGRVMELDGSMISIEWDEAPEHAPAFDELSPAD